MNTVIYYPHIYPPREWLTLAAFCWDKVYLPSVSTYKAGDPKVDDLVKQLDGFVDKSLDISEGMDQRSVEDFQNWVICKEDEFRQHALDPQAQELFQVLDYKFQRPISDNERSLLGWLVQRGFAKIEKPNEDDFTDILPPPRPLPEWLAEVARKRDEAYQEKIRKRAEKRTRLAKELTPEEFRKIYGYTPDSSSDSRISATTTQLSVQPPEPPEREWTEAGHSAYIAATKVLLPKDIAKHYLSRAAAGLAERHKADLATTDNIFTDVVFHRQRSLGGQVVTSIIQAYLPTDVDQLEIGQIADFRRETASQRLIFQKEVQKLVADYETVSSDSELGRLKNSIADIARARIDQVARSYRNAKIGVALKAFSVSLTPPALMTAIGSMLGIGLLVPAGIVAAVTAFGASALLEFDKARSDRAASPWSYVLNAGKLA